MTSESKLHKKQREASGVVFGAFDEIVETDLSLHPRNPNEHPPEQLRLYLKIIQANGWRRAPVISNRSGFVTKGNGAVMAARLGGLKHIPVNYQDPSDEAELQDMLADNELARLSASDESRLKEILKDLEGQGHDLELAGILKKLDEPTELKPLPILPPPKMAWVLIGIPLISYGKITAHIEAIARAPEALIESTFTDAPDQKN